MDGAAGGGSKPGMAGDVRLYQSSAAAPAARHSPGVAASQIKRVRFTAGMFLLGHPRSLCTVKGSWVHSQQYQLLLKWIIQAVFLGGHGGYNLARSITVKQLLDRIRAEGRNLGNGILKVEYVTHD